MNQTQFADFLELPYKKWNHYERGYPIPRETALIMRKKISGFSTDWLWEGDTSGLSQVLYSKILEAEQQEVKEHRPHKPARHQRVRVLTKVRRRIPRTLGAARS